MNKPAVTKAQLKRAVEAVEALGKTVAGLRINPDGSADVLLTGSGAAPRLILQADLHDWCERRQRERFALAS